MAPKPAIPAKLTDELLAHKTLGLRVAIVDAPELALRLLAFTLAAAFIGEASASCLSIRVDNAEVARSISRAQSKARDEIAAIETAWRSRLPVNPEELWASIQTMAPSHLFELVAVAIASGIDLRRVGPLSGMEARQELGETLCAAAGLDMSKYWQASIDSYFAHIRKDAIVEAIVEVSPHLDRAALGKAAKKEVLARAKKAFKRVNWLPPVLRTGARTEAPAISAK